MPASQPVGMLYLVMADLRAQLLTVRIDEQDAYWGTGLVDGEASAPVIATPDDLQRLRTNLAELVVYAALVAREYGVSQ